MLLFGLNLKKRYLIYSLLKGESVLTELLSPVKNSIEKLDLILKTNHSVPEIPDLLNRTVLLGGKRLRPALCFLMGQALGVTSDRMTPFARAAEFTHSASLAHDDVVDNAATRRSTRTINAESSSKRAVLAGDLLLARVMVELSEQGDVEIIHDLAMVVEDLVNGEWLQIDIRGNIDTTLNDLIEVSKRKTASLMSWCCVVAARVSEFNSSDLRQICSDFGENLGIAFQMVDDVIDFTQSGEKDFAKDLKEGIVNYVISDLLKRKPEYKSATEALLGKSEIETFPWSKEDLEASIQNVRSLSQAYLKQAEEKLSEIKKSVPPKNEIAKESYASLETLLHFLSMRGH
jgi:geranylgeranyl pyrophosphate synthase